MEIIMASIGILDFEEFFGRKNEREQIRGEFTMLFPES